MSFLTKTRALKAVFLAFLVTLSFASDAQVPAGNRKVGLHIGQSETEPFDTAMASSRSQGCTNIYHLFFLWPEIEVGPGQITGYWDTLLPLFGQYINALGMEVELNFPVINTVKKEIPTDIAGLAWDDTVLSNRSIRYLDTLLSNIFPAKVTLLNIGNEIDGILTDTLEVEAYRLYFQRVSEGVKQHYLTLHGGDTLRTGMTIMFDGLTDPSRVALYKRLNSAADVISTTYYGTGAGFLVKTPQQCGQDIRLLAATYAAEGKPIFMQEIGYPTSPTLNSTDAKQADFVTEVFEAWDDYPTLIETMLFFLRSDWSQATVDTLAVYYGFPNNLAFKEFLRTLGFRTYPGMGADKLAMARLRCEAEARGFCLAGCQLGVGEAQQTDLEGHGLNIYPNPASDILRVSLLKNEEIEQAFIYDAQGRMVGTKAVSKSGGEFSINVSSLPEGLYTIYFGGASGRFVVAR